MAEQNTPLTPLNPEQKRQALEAILFAAGYPMPYTKLAEALDMPPSKVKSFAKAWQEEYNDAPDRGIMLLCFEDTCQLCGLIFCRQTWRPSGGSGGVYFETLDSGCLSGKGG